MTLGNLKLLDQTISTLLAARFGGAGNRASNDFDPTFQAVARGSYRFQVRLLPSGMYYTSNDTYQIVAVEVTVAYRLAAGETVKYYLTEKSPYNLLGSLEVLLIDSYWQGNYYVKRLAEGGSFVANEIATVGDVVTFTIAGSVVLT